MAYDGNGNLFGVENSCGRDHHEEMNWLRRGKHYGFPYIMGDTYNPQQYANYIPANDFMISHYSPSWSIHTWTNDPGFPAAPAVSFEVAIQNYGPDCDKFRDTLTGGIKDASDLGISMGTFTAHRSPLGLVFDSDSLTDAPYTGDGFMLSWTPGLDSCGCTAIPDSSTGPFVDPSEDLVHLHLMYDSLHDNYTLTAERIVSSFHNPVDAVIDSNFIYVIENGYGATSGFFKITLPPLQTKMQQVISEINSKIYPNPASDVISIVLNSDKASVVIYNDLGEQIQTSVTSEFNKAYIDCSKFRNGIYLIKISDGNKELVKKVSVVH